MGKLAERMPIVDAFIDDLRATFGREEIDQAIVRGIRDGTFYAQENGHVVGAPLSDDSARTVKLCDCFPWNGW